MAYTSLLLLAGCTTIYQTLDPTQQDVGAKNCVPVRTEVVAVGLRELRVNQLFAFAKGGLGLLSRFSRCWAVASTIWAFTSG